MTQSGRSGQDAARTQRDRRAEERGQDDRFRRLRAEVLGDRFGGQEFVQQTGNEKADQDEQGPFVEDRADFGGYGDQQFDRRTSDVSCGRTRR